MCLRLGIAESMNLSCSTAMLIHSSVRGIELRMCRCPSLQNRSASILAESALPVHPFSHMCVSPFFCSAPSPRRRLLYVGDDLGVLYPLKQELTAEGWLIVRAPTGSPARLLVRSEIRYDLLLFDDEAAGASGMELVGLARSVAHRKRTPIILLAVADCGIAARRAGADKCLRKPDHLYALVETVREMGLRFPG